MTIADTLSRACTTDNTTDRMEEELKCTVHLILDTSMSEMWLQEIKAAINEDQSMQKLKIHIRHGWPEEQSQVPEEIRGYWHLRDRRWNSTQRGETDSSTKISGEACLIEFTWDTLVSQSVHNVREKWCSGLA